jgi:hypothetical protein
VVSPTFKTEEIFYKSHMYHHPITLDETIKSRIQDFISEETQNTEYLHLMQQRGSKFINAAMTHHRITSRYEFFIYGKSDDSKYLNLLFGILLVDYFKKDGCKNEVPIYYSAEYYDRWAQQYLEDFALNYLQLSLSDIAQFHVDDTHHASISPSIFQKHWKPRLSGGGHLDYS